MFASGKFQFGECWVRRKTIPCNYFGWGALHSLSASCACFVTDRLVVVFRNLTMSRIMTRDVLHWLSVSLNLGPGSRFGSVVASWGRPQSARVLSLNINFDGLLAEIFFLHLGVNLAHTSTTQRRAFSKVDGPTIWNNLPSDLRALLVRDS